MPLTASIVKNLAEKIRGQAVGKNQVVSFIGRHKAELKSVYLKSIDNKRIKEEFPTTYKVFY